MGVSKPQPWQVWWLNQKDSRSKTDPSQPTDESKPRRMYLIVSSWANSSKVTACPIQTNHNGRISQTEVELLITEYPSFISNGSKIICQDIVTVPSSSFGGHVGSLKDIHRDKVKIALKFYLKLV